jgi:hypothetical protein
MIKALERFMSHERYFTLSTAKATMWARNVKWEDWLNEAKHGMKEQETQENWQHEW